jgi:hypothetical protein
MILAPVNATEATDNPVLSIEAMVRDDMVVLTKMFQECFMMLVCFLNFLNILQ